MPVGRQIPRYKPDLILQFLSGRTATGGMAGRWQPDATEFTVGTSCFEGRGYQCTVPMPIVRRPGLKKRITFKVPGKDVIVLPGQD